MNKLNLGLFIYLVFVAQKNKKSRKFIFRKLVKQGICMNYVI